MDTTRPEFSIIIPFQGPNDLLAQTLDRIGHLAGPSFEVLLLPDDERDAAVFGKRAYPLTIIPTGPVSPAIKRDKGAEAAQGATLAFIDDDAYPAPDWLERMRESFGEGVAAVGGPQVTPPEDPFWAQVSGAMFLSCLNGGAARRYQAFDGTMEVDDWPSVNLCVRRDDFLAVGGFDSAYWPGEDTKLCHDLVHGLGKRIVADGRAVVYHHRRPGLRRHMRQVGGYGLHRGHFARKFPKTSLRPAYFAPSAFFLFVCLGWIALAGGAPWAVAYGACWAAYLAALLVSLGCVFCLTRRPGVALAAQGYLALTHFWYGLRFLQGLAARDLHHGLGR